MRITILSLFIAQTLFSVVPGGNRNDNLSLINLESPSTATIEGCVNTITGHFLHTSNDLFISGSEPLFLERYLADKLHFAYGEHSWRNFGFNFSSFLDMNYGNALNEGSGARMILENARKRRDGSQAFRLQSDHVKLGVTNFSGDILGRKNHLRYLRVDTYDKLKRGIVTYPDGTKRHYAIIRNKKLNQDWMFPTREELPSGAKYEYQYIRNYGLSQINLTARNGDLLSSIRFVYPASNKELKAHPYFDAIGSNGQSARYHLVKNKYGVSFTITSVEKSHAPKESQKFYHTKNGWLERIRVRKPECRYRDVIFYHYGKQKTRDGILELAPNISEIKKEILAGRVHKLRSPVGENDTPVVTHSFDYNIYIKHMRDPEEDYITGGNTIVYDAHGYKTTHHFNRNFQLHKIEKFTGSKPKRYKLYSTENYKYDQAGQLTHRYYDQIGQGTLFCRAFTYNEHGNVLSDTLLGNLSGKEIVKTVQMQNGTPVSNGIDTYTKKYQYTSGPYRNILHETDGIQETFYQYLEGTNLLTAKLTGPVGSIEAREFYEYNGRGELITKITDDGSKHACEDLTHVTCRKIERREYANNFPFKIDNLYFNPASGQEELFSRTRITSSRTGKPIDEQFFDGNDTLLYTLHKEYDAHDNLILATDALGVTTTFSYDKNDLLIAQEREGIFKKNTYDFVNRLVKEEIYGADGYQSQSFGYNYLSQKVCARDTWGNETRFQYDAFGRPIREFSPSYIGSNQEVISPVICREYDSFGNITQLTTPSGYTIHSAYNIAGNLIHSWDAEGTLERCEYSLKGHLFKKRERSGVETHYTYDYAGRVLEETLYDASGAFVRKNSTTYKGPFKLSETNSAGVNTTYTYNFKGQCTAKKTADLVTHYIYDTLGRIITEQTGDCVKHITYDFLDRIVEESIDGRIARKIFDAHGRVIEEHQGEAITRTQYNAIGLPVRITDPEGRVTFISYKEDFINSLGQKVRLTIQTHPNGTQTETEFNAQGQIARQSTRATFGDLLQESRHFYDHNRKLSETIATVIAPNKVPHERKILYQYDPQGRLVTLKDGAGTPEQKTTHYRYNTLGQKISEMQANGIEIQTTYDPLGRVATLKTSDHTVDYTYHYDHLDHLIAVHDHKQNTATTKTYDQFGQLINEKLANNLQLSYTYDQVGRLCHIQLPDTSSIDYTYKGTELESVIRGSHTHTYLERNSQGKPITEILPNKTVRTSTYALSGQKLSITNPNFSDQVLTRDISGNMLHRKKQGQDFVYHWDELHQLTKENTSSYLHDSIYNRTQAHGNDYTLNTLNQVTNDGKNTYTYDLNGNLTQCRGMQLHYDGLNRLIEVQTAEGTITYTYDAENRRMTQKVAETTLFYYMGMNELGSISPTQTALRIWGEAEGGERNAGILLEINCKVYIPLYDLTGNIAQLQDLSGNNVEEYTCDLFGVESHHNSISPWRYSSKRVDTETTFVYFGHRYYDPTLGRWATADPQGYAAGPNLYAYVMNNPIAHMDQYGLIAESPSETTKPNQRRKQIQVGKRRLLLGAQRIYITTPSPQDIQEVTPQGKCSQVRKPHLEIFDSELNIYVYNQDRECVKYFINFMNGISNNLEDATKSTINTSIAYGGARVYLLYNPTGGFTDLGRAASEVCGYYTTACKTAEKAMLKLYTTHPELACIHNAHSEGVAITARVLNRIPREYLHKTHVFAFGGAAIINNKHLAGRVNYISSRDGVPHITCGFSLLEHAVYDKKEHIRVLPGRGFFGLDHAFNGRTYQGAVESAAEFMRNKQW